MSFNIQFDFRFDTKGFFTDAARAALDFAASLWEDVILDDFPDVLPGVSFTILDPSGSGAWELVTLETPIDDVRIFVGASSPPFGIAGDALARGGPDGFDVQGDTFWARISNDFRGQGPVTDFEPFAGTISFDPTVNWSFDIDDPAPGAMDFVMVAAHEIGHVLGIGTSGIFDQRSAGQGFDGPNARAVNNGQPIPLEADLGHITEGFANDSTLMDPVAPQPGIRNTPTDFDLALLADIGFEVEGFEAQGSTPPIATNEGETIFGTVVDDVINGLGGDDQIQGNDGDDVLNGGAGVDMLFGQAGADSLNGGTGDDSLSGGGGNDLLIGGPGDDNLFGGAGADIAVVAPGDGKATFNDFEVGIDRIQIDPGFGFTSAEAVLDTISKPFSNVSRLNLDAETTMDIFHDIQAGSPLTADDIAIVNQTPPTGDSNAEDTPLIPPAPPNGTIAFTQDADPILIGQGTLYLGGGGQDVYIISQAVVPNETSLIQDSGENVVQLVDGLQISSSLITANALQLDLDNGARIQILGASNMVYETGGSAEQGTQGTSRDYATFAQEVLGAEVPDNGQVESGPVTISNGDGTTVVLSQGDTMGIGGTAEAFVYEFTVQDGRATNVGDGEVSIDGFNASEDILRFNDVSDAFSTEDFLAEDNGVVITENPFEDETTITFDTDDQGVAGVVKLVGIQDADLSETMVEVV